MANYIELTKEESRIPSGCVMLIDRTTNRADVHSKAKNITATSEYCTFYDEDGECKYINGNDYKIKIYPYDEGKPAKKKGQLSIFDYLEGRV